MQTIAINSPGLAQAGIFNANAEGNQIGNFGLEAPRPSWVLPAERRTNAQTSGEFRVRGPNEYHGLRDFTWSDTENLFYGADEAGLFRLTADGQSTKVAAPAGGAQYKGITFFDVNNERMLLASDRDGPELYTLNPETGEQVGAPVTILDPNVPIVGIAGVLSLVEHPNGDELWGIGKGATAFTRTLIRIDPLTGETDLLKQLDVHLADLAWVFPVVGPVTPTWNVDADGNWSVATNWTGGVPSGAGVSASFLGVITAARTVTVDGPRTVGNLTFDNTNSYTIAGPGPLTLDDGGTPTISVLNGSHTISSPLRSLPTTPWKKPARARSPSAALRPTVRRRPGPRRPAR